jgi:hypothetical protein
VNARSYGLTTLEVEIIQLALDLFTEALETESDGRVEKLLYREGNYEDMQVRLDILSNVLKGDTHDSNSEKLD